MGKTSEDLMALEKDLRRKKEIYEQRMIEFEQQNEKFEQEKQQFLDFSQKKGMLIDNDIKDRKMASNATQESIISLESKL